MKKILLSSLMAAAAAMPALAGVDNINYQAVIKNGTEVVANKSVDMKFELLDNETVVYSDEQNLTTNAAGYVSCQLGGEELSTIKWGDLTLRVSVNLGSGYEVISTEAVSSVPTALYALRSADSDMIIEEVEKLVQDNENTKTTLLGVNAQLAGIEGFIEDVDAFNTELSEKLEPMMGLNYEEICDFHERVSNQLIVINETLEEMQGTDLHAYIDTLNTLKAELEAKLKDLDGFAAAMDEVNDLKLQVENLNQVSAVVRANEEAIEALNDSCEQMATMLGNNIDKLQKQADATDSDLENIKENLTNSFNAVDAQIEEINGQLEPLQNVAAVVRANEEEIEGIKASSEQMASMLEAQIAKTNNNLGVIDETVEGLVKDNEETQATLRNMSADIAQIEGLATEIEALNTQTDAFATMVETRFDKIQNQADATDNEVEGLSKQVQLLEDAVKAMNAPDGEDSINAKLAQMMGMIMEEINAIKEKLGMPVED
ncbi:MAG: hypothetical protein K2N35_06830 [Muribaculaceae bacterium]|nr:hypothetical protein [Muribaculaceae bacterium]